jgi:hypothetical protein
MKKIISTLTLLLALAAPSQAQFTPGNLVVLRVGDGVQTLANTGNTIFLDQILASDGSSVNTVTIPDTLPNGLFVTGNATSEGQLSRSADGRFLTFGGYNTNRPTPASVVTSTSTDVPRGIGVVDASGTYSLAAVTTTQFTTSNIRSGVTDGTNNFWGAGANSGTIYFGNLAPAAVVQSSVLNTRVVNIFNGDLYFSTASGTIPGIYFLGTGGMPAGTATTNLLISTAGTGTGTSSPYDFAINSNRTLVYIADDRTIANGGGIQRWEFNGAAWNLIYTIGTGSGSVSGARSLAVDFSGANPLIYAVTAESTANRVIAISDTGPGAGAAATTLKTALTKEIFRGVKFSPVTPAVVVPPPTLSISLAPSAVVLSWPTNAVNYQLQTVPSLPGGTNWTFGGNAAVVGDHYAVTNSLTSSNAFYRLFLPPS